LEVALAISFLLSLALWGEQSSILGESDGTGVRLIRYLRGFSRFAPSGIRQSSRKLQVGAAIEISKSVETELGDALGAQLSAVVSELALNPVNEEAELPRIDVPLMRRAVQAGEELVAIEWLALAVALDHLEHLRDRPLIGGEAVAARGALTAPADSAVGDATGLEGLGGGVAAGTVHSSESTGQ
jgi:hypothetical protein